MSLTIYVILSALLLATELLYLRMARRLRLFDKPNLRSAHAEVMIIRGGGILFCVAGLASVLLGQVSKPYFFMGLTLIALISFWDDLYAVPKRYRLGVQFVGTSLLVMQMGQSVNQGWLVIPLIIIGVGMLNAYNFMDGINGMTALYSLVTVGTLWYWQDQQANSSNDLMLPCVCIALVIFSYFNVRRRAVCFAGDVGSISIAFIVLSGLLDLILRQQTYLPILFLAVYGVDSVLTILHRLYLGQNIFQAHQLHLFQLLVHQLRWPHLRVSAVYALVQLMINIFVLEAIVWPLKAQLLLTGTILGSFSIFYIILKKRLSSL